MPAAKVAAGLGAWLGSVALAAHHSLGVPTGVDQLGEHLPLLLAIGGGIAAVWTATAKVVALISTAKGEVREIVREELSAHTAREEAQLADVLRRVAKVERIVDSRGKPPSAPYAVARAPEDGET